MARLNGTDAKGHGGVTGAATEIPWVMISSLTDDIDQFIASEQLPGCYRSTAEHWFLPLLEQLLQKIAVNNGTYVVGISGSQGSGKSTLAALLVMLMKQTMGLAAISLSIDDFYLTHSARQQLASKIHPLFATRGVPGTHDVQLALATIHALKNHGEVAVPRFDKALDDRLPKKDWPLIRAPVDVIVFEGWCLGIGQQDQSELQQPINELERNEDPHGIWRRHVNDVIGEEYENLYAIMDYLIMLKAPSFDKVYEWRRTQEEKLARGREHQANTRIMNQEQLRRFIQHYERVTRHGLDTLPARADVVFQLNDEQAIVGRS